MEIVLIVIGVSLVCVFLGIVITLLLISKALDVTLGDMLPFLKKKEKPIVVETVENEEAEAERILGQVDGFVSVEWDYEIVDPGEYAELAQEIVQAWKKQELTLTAANVINSIEMKRLVTWVIVAEKFALRGVFLTFVGKDYGYDELDCIRSHYMRDQVYKARIYYNPNTDLITYGRIPGLV